MNEGEKRIIATYLDTLDPSERKFYIITINNLFKFTLNPSIEEVHCNEWSKTEEEAFKKGIQLLGLQEKQLLREN
jgi:hypothetical protein